VHSSNPSVWSPTLFGPSEHYFSASIGEFRVFEPFLRVLALIIWRVCSRFCVACNAVRVCARARRVRAVPTAIGLVRAVL